MFITSHIVVIHFYISMSGVTEEIRGIILNLFCKDKY